MEIRTIITGATGMVGEGVLLECLNHPDVAEVLVINRKPGGVSHPKLHELIHADFFDLTAIEKQLIGYNACFFCLGVSSIGMSTEDYKHVTYDLTLNMARLLAKLNPEMAFCYVTGAGTDSSEQGRIAWALACEGCHGKCPDTAVRTGVYVPSRLYESYAGAEECEPLL
jgi:nucleoside-diphosphate-sugar epimerase